MASPVAVIGSSSLNIGFGVAADLSLADHEVRFAHWPDRADSLADAVAQDGFEVRGNAAELVSGRLGHARPAMITTDVPAALRGAEVVFLDVEPAELEVRFVALAELAGVAAPLHRAMIAIAEALLGADFWASGLTLRRLGVSGFNASEITRYVEEGPCPS